MIELHGISRALVALSAASLRLSGLRIPEEIERLPQVHHSVWHHAGVDTQSGARTLTALAVYAVSECRLAGLDDLSAILLSRSLGPLDDGPEATTWAPSLATQCLEFAALALAVRAGMMPAADAEELAHATPFGESVFRDAES